MNKAITAILITAVLTSGCASIMQGQDQTMVVTTTGKAQECSMTNSEGGWRSTPGRPVTIKRDSDDLAVTCYNGEYATTQFIESDLHAGYLVADFFIWDLCLISCWIDTLNGSAYSYPKVVNITMPKE